MVVSSHQPVLKVQPFQKTQQPPVHVVHPQPIQTIPHPPQQQQQQQTSPHEGINHHTSATSYVVNLTPEQLEQLKRNGQLTVNGQTIYMQRPNKIENNQENKNKLSSPPKTKPVKKVLQQNKVCVCKIKT